MKKNWLVFFMFLSVVANAQKDLRPNIIVFLVDDMGVMDNSVPFCDSIMPLNKRFHTPNMEQMAREGMKFVNAYAQPVCTPSRVSMLTGMNAARTRVTSWTSPVKDDNTDVADSQFAPLDWNLNGLNPYESVPNMVNATPFPQLLKQAGYYTIHVGKAHWGSMGTPAASPYNMGFMVNISGHSGGHPQSYLSEQRYGNMPGKSQPQAVPDLEEYYDTGIFLTEALTREAIRAMETPIARNEPFYLNMAHYAVHLPIMADPRFVQKYYNAGLDSLEAQYASLIEGMDKSLGDIMKFLKEKKVENNTVIIFMSDNGGFDRRDKNINTHNAPFRSGKGSVYEGGIREPMIVKWPGMIASASINRSNVIIEDLFPTVLSIAGITRPKIIQKTDGVSLVPIFKNPQAILKDRLLIFHYPNKSASLKEEELLGINYYSALRYNNWKLLYRMRTQQFELYDLGKDIREVNNLAASHKTEVRRLAVLLGKALKDRNAQMPVSKATGKPVPFPDEIF
ncbi:MAG: sulfatase [Chitinophagaceae bacterium]|nr:sulfatase [Chitinophagaceae bacterium]